MVNCTLLAGDRVSEKVVIRCW